jgi:hypothetical protein
VIVTSEALANTFRAFLQHDYAVSHDAIDAARKKGTDIARGVAALDVRIEALAVGKAPHQFFALSTSIRRPCSEALTTK